MTLELSCGLTPFHTPAGDWLIAGGGDELTGGTLLSPPPPPPHEARKTATKQLLRDFEIEVIFVPRLVFINLCQQQNCYSSSEIVKQGATNLQALDEGN